MNDTTPHTGQLAKALIAAQASIKAIPHDARNDFHKYRYTSAEAILTECKAVLAANGLALLPGDQSIVALEGQLLLVRHFTLLHTSGEERLLTTAWPIVPDKGRPADKATASAATTSLAYLLRDLLLAPRVDPSDDLAGREDRPEPARKRPAATPSKDGTEQIGHEGAQKLITLADRKKVTLDDYLEPHGLKFTPLAEVSKEIGRTVFRQLQALPDPPVTSNGNGKAPARITTPF